MTTTPYRLKLKKVSGDKERLLRAVYEYLPAIGIEDGLQRAVKEAVAGHTGEEFGFRLEAVHREDFETYSLRLPRPVISAVIGMAPLARKAVLEIDAPIAMTAIARLLGSSSEANIDARELSDTEQGVLQYLLLQILLNIHKISGGDERVHFRFERFAFNPDEIRTLAAARDSVAVLVFMVKLGGVNGFVRLALPDPFVQEAFIRPLSLGEERPAGRAFLKERLERFGYVCTQVTAEAGRVALGAGDLSALEEGDIIIFDHSGLKLANGRPHGKVVLRVGDGLLSGIDADIVADETKTHCKIIGIHKGD